MKKLFAIFMIFNLTSLAVVAAPTFSQPNGKTPRVAAQGLYNAWSKKSRKTARNFAASEAVEKLFGVKWRKMQFKGCAKREEGDFECIYEDKKLDLTLAMLTETTRRGYRIKSLSFSSEAE